MYGPAAAATERCLDDTLAELVQSSVTLADPPPPQQPKHLLRIVIYLIILSFIKFCTNDFLIEKGKDTGLHYHVFSVYSM